MSLITLKFVLSLGLFGAGLIAFWTMLTMMGRTERSMEPGALRALHRVFGYIALVLTVVVGVIGYQLAAASGSAVTQRAVLHCALASLFFVVFMFKVVIARHYRQFLKHMPVLGFIAFALLFAVVSITAGYRIARGIWPPTRQESLSETAAEQVGADSALALARSGDADAGQAVYAANCSGCHAHASDEVLVGPGLAGLVSHEVEETGSRKEAFDEILGQILYPTGAMPSFEGELSSGELADLLAYLDTL